VIMPALGEAVTAYLCAVVEHGALT
jgi:hypothetical protein